MSSLDKIRKERRDLAILIIAFGLVIGCVLYDLARAVYFQGISHPVASTLGHDIAPGGRVPFQHTRYRPTISRVGHQIDFHHRKCHFSHSDWTARTTGKFFHKKKFMPLPTIIPWCCRNIFRVRTSTTRCRYGSAPIPPQQSMVATI